MSTSAGYCYVLEAVSWASNVLLLCAPNSPPKSALHIEQAADGMRGDHRSLGHPKGWTGPPKSMPATHILQGPMWTHTSYLKREQQPVEAAGRRLRPDDVDRHQSLAAERRRDAHP